MLVLTRKTQQSIVIGDDIEIAVLSVSGDKVRLGISAPKSVPVFRKEIHDRNRVGASSTRAQARDGGES